MTYKLPNFTQYAIFDLGPRSRVQWLGPAESTEGALRQFFADVIAFSEGVEYNFRVIAVTNAEAHALELWCKRGWPAADPPGFSGYARIIETEDIRALLGAPLS